MLSPVARVLDMHTCPMQTPAIVPIPHVGGPVVGPGALTVMAGGIPVSVVGDFAVCFGPPDSMVVGSFTVLAMGKPVVRITDVTAHGGMVLVGCPTVLVGDSGGAGSAAAAAMSAAKAGGSAFASLEASLQPPKPSGGGSSSGGGGGGGGSGPPAPPVTAWIEVQLVDEQGKPIPYQKAEVTDPKGAVHTAFGNDQGVARVNNIAPGTCHVSYPDLDRDAWALA